MRLHRPARKDRPENTIALINVVFLMLIFFLIAGTLAPPLDKEVTLISSEREDPAEPPDALTARADGSLYYRGGEISEQAHIDNLNFMAGPGGKLVVRLVPDRNLPAVRLIEIVTKLHESGAEAVQIVTERSVR